MTKRQGHKKSKLKFTSKKESLWGYAAIALDIGAVIVFFTALAMSVADKGQSSVYLGSRGMASLLLALAGVVVGLQGVRQKDAYLFFPKCGTLAGIFILIFMIALYVVGLCL